MKQGRASQAYKEFEIINKIPLWVRFCLWFINPRISTDFASNNWICWKRFRGVIYIINEGKE